MVHSMIMMIEMREKVAWTGSLAVAYEKAQNREFSLVMLELKDIQEYLGLVEKLSSELRSTRGSYSSEDPTIRLL